MVIDKKTKGKSEETVEVFFHEHESSLLLNRNMLHIANEESFPALEIESLDASLLMKTLMKNIHLCETGEYTLSSNSQEEDVMKKLGVTFNSTPYQKTSSSSKMVVPTLGQLVIILNNVSNDEDYKTNYPLAHHVKISGLHAALAVPLINKLNGSVEFVLEFFFPRSCLDTEAQPDKQLIIDARTGENLKPLPLEEISNMIKASKKGKGVSLSWEYKKEDPKEEFIMLTSNWDNNHMGQSHNTFLSDAEQFQKALKPNDLQPPDYKALVFFRGCIEDNYIPFVWAKNPLKMEVLSVHHEVKRLLDHCQNEIVDMQDEKESTRPPDSVHHALLIITNHSNGNYLELTDVLSNLPLISEVLSEGITVQLNKDGFISKTRQDKYIENKDSMVKSLLDTCDRDHEEDGRKIHCIFFEKGYCPFGNECWFSHEAVGEADTSYVQSHSYGELVGHCCWKTYISKVFLKPELRLAGGKQKSKKGPIGIEKLNYVKNHVSSSPNQLLTPGLVKSILGETVHDQCYKKDSPVDITCFFETYDDVETGLVYNNLLLRWQSKKKVDPFEDGVTRVDRKWVELSEEEKLKTGPFHSESVHSMVGGVRNQHEHNLCWIFVGVNLVSSLRVINNVDPVFVTLSVKDACFFASPHDRLKSTATEGHKCHPLQISAALKYIKEEGVRIHPENEPDTFDCIKDIPKKDGVRIKIADFQYLGCNLKQALKVLETQPIGATIVLFSDFWDIKEDIYLGPTSNNSVYEGLHAVLVVDAFLVNGELVMWCKSSHGVDKHSEGYFMVATSIMVTALHYGVSDRHPTYGINHGNKPLDEPFDLTTPQPLIHDFVYPMLDSKNKRKR